MGSFVYDTISMLFGGGLADTMTDWMSGLFETLMGLVEGDFLTTTMTIFSAIACSLLVLYFFMDLVNQAKSDIISLEKLIVSFIKILTAVVILVCLPDILKYMVQIGDALFNAMSASGDGTIRSAITESTSTVELFPDIALSDSGRSSYYVMPEWTDAVEEAFDDTFGGFFGFLGNIKVLFLCLIAGLLGLIAKIAGYFICTLNALSIIVRMIFAPIGVVQLFEDGSRSSGIRYLKKLAADCITMGIIVVVLIACSAITGGLINNLAGIESIEISTISDVISFGNLAIILVPQIVAIGAMGFGSKIAHDVLGVN